MVGKLRKTKETSARTVGSLANIRTVYLQDTSLERYATPDSSVRAEVLNLGPANVFCLALVLCHADYTKGRQSFLGRETYEENI
jgi:hypothetical protein